MAKLNFKSEVRQTDVDEALKLMDYSIKSLAKVSNKPSAYKRTVANENRSDKMASVMSNVRDIMGNNQMIPTSINDIHKKMKKMSSLHQNITLDELMDVLNYYQGLSVVHIDPE